MKTNGSAARITAESRPSADNDRICRCSRSRSRSVSATVPSSSARLPPTSRWILIAITIQEKSRLWVRAAMPSSASSAGSPSRVSIRARLNSIEIGGLASRITESIACGREYPACRLPASSCRVSGSCPRKAASRRDCRIERNTQGATKPISRPNRVAGGSKLLSR